MAVSGFFNDLDKLGVRFWSLYPRRPVKDDTQRDTGATIGAERLRALEKWRKIVCVCACLHVHKCTNVCVGRAAHPCRFLYHSASINF